MSFFQNDFVEIFPLEHMPSYGIIFKVVPTDEFTSYAFIGVEHDRLVLTYTRSRRNGFETANVDSIIAIDEEYEYSFSFVSSIIGSPDNFLINLSYTVGRIAKNV